MRNILRLLTAFVFISLITYSNSFAFTPEEGSPLAKKQHPRLIITDWVKMKNKILSDPSYNSKYETLKTFADQKLTYLFTGNPSEADTIALPIIFVGMVEKAKGNDISKYTTKITEFMNKRIEYEYSKNQFINGNADARNNKLHLIPSLAYDWFYNEFSITEKTNYGNFLKGMGDTLLTDNNHNKYFTDLIYGTHPTGSYVLGIIPALAISGDNIIFDSKSKFDYIPTGISPFGDSLMDNAENLFKSYQSALEELNFPVGGLLEGWQYNCCTDTPHYNLLIYNISSWESATGEDLSQTNTKNFKNFPTFAMFSLLDDKTGQRYGYGDGGNGAMSSAEFTLYTKGFSWIWAWFADYSNNSYAQYLKNRANEPQGSDIVWYLIFDNKSISETTPQNFP